MAYVASFDMPAGDLNEAEGHLDAAEAIAQLLGGTGGALSAAPISPSAHLV
jgi:hypothetical protein